MRTILEFVAVASVGIIPNIYTTIISIRKPSYAEMFSPMERLFSGFLGAVSSIAVVVLVSLSQSEGLKSVGFFSEASDSTPDPSIPDPFSILVASLVGVTSILWLAQRLLHIDPKRRLAPSKPYIAQIAQYDRTPWERLAYSAGLPLGVIAEELVYRGYLVLLLGTHTGTYIPWIVLSIALSVVVHLYQGRDSFTILSHLLLAGFFVGAAVYTGSIIPGIMIHSFVNIGFTLRIWSQASRQKEAVDGTGGRPEDEATLYVLARGASLAALILIAASVLTLASLCCVCAVGGITINDNPIDIW